jgi:hypothetical protein
MTLNEQKAYIRAASQAVLTGTPFESLADWAARERAQEEAAKVVSLADERDKREKLRPTTER